MGGRQEVRHECVPALPLQQGEKGQIPDVFNAWLVDRDISDPQRQTLDVRQDGSVVRLKTVTAVVEGCALDWVLSVGGDHDFEAAERDFDAWWQSFRPPTAAAAEAAS